MKPTPMKLHLLDKTKGSLFASVGTACGIRLQQDGESYYSERPGTLNYTVLRLVTDRKGIVTCRNCQRCM